MPEPGPTRDWERNDVQWRLDGIWINCGANHAAVLHAKPTRPKPIPENSSSPFQKFKLLHFLRIYYVRLEIMHEAANQSAWVSHVLFSFNSRDPTAAETTHPIQTIAVLTNVNDRYGLQYPYFCGARIQAGRPF